MADRPTVLVSAVSSELRSYRLAVRDVLLAKGVFPLVQDTFPTDYREVRAMLEDYLRRADAVICLVGFAFGAEPHNVPGGQTRRSYTQLEYDLARELNKPVYVFLTDDRDRPCDTVPSEGAERAQLQVAYRNAIQSGDRLWHSFATVEELKLKIAQISDDRYLPREDPSCVTIERVTDAHKHKDDLWVALELYSSRLPEEERYDNAELLSLIKHHLSGKFGPHRPSADWRAYLFVAKQANDIVGMLLGYRDVGANLAFVPYLVAKRPQRGRLSAPDISRRLLGALLDAIRASGDPGQQLRFLSEVDDPSRTSDAKERKRRLARIKLFEQAVESLGLSVRCLDLAYVQPRLDPTRRDTGLLLLYVAEGLPLELSKPEVIELLTWLYTSLYSEDIFEDPDEGKRYAEHTREVLKQVTAAVPDHVRLLRGRQL